MIELNISHPTKREPFFTPLESKTVRVKKFQNRAHFAQFFGPKSSTKRNDGKADILLKFGGKSFKAHKNVMRDASDLFEMLPIFQKIKQPKGSKNPKQCLCEFDLNTAKILPEGCKASMLDKVIDFAYTGRLPNFPAKDYLDFFTIAVALHFYEACSAYFKQFNFIYGSPYRSVTTKEAANVLSLTQKIKVSNSNKSKCAVQLENLCEGTCEYLLRVKEPLHKLIRDTDFLKYMSADGMEAFLDVDDIAKPNEEIKVLDLALAWLRYDRTNREKYAKKVLQKVHLGLLSRDRLVALCTEMKSVECKQLIEKVVQLMDTKDKVTIPLEYSHYQWFGTRSEMWCDSLVAFSPGAQSLVFFDPYGPRETDGWHTWCEYQPILNPPMKYRTYRFSALSVDGKVYLAGGCHYKKMNKISASGHLVRGWKYWNTRHVFEGNLGVRYVRKEEKEDYAYMHFVNPWCAYPPMMTARKAFPMVHLDGYLYAIGGEDNESEAMKEAERYSFKDKKWEKIADLPVPCYYAAATVYKGKILVYGSQPVPCTSTAAQHDLQMYDPATDKWTVLLTEHHVIAKYKEMEDWDDSDDCDEEDKMGTGDVEKVEDKGDKETDGTAQSKDKDDVQNGEKVPKVKDSKDGNGNDKIKIIGVCNAERKTDKETNDVEKDTKMEDKDDSGNANNNNMRDTKQSLNDGNAHTNSNLRMDNKSVQTVGNGVKEADKRCKDDKSKNTEDKKDVMSEGNGSVSQIREVIAEKSKEVSESADVDNKDASKRNTNGLKADTMSACNDSNTRGNSHNNNVKETDNKGKDGDEIAKKDDIKDADGKSREDKLKVSLIDDYDNEDCDSDQDLDWNNEESSQWIPKNGLVIDGEDCFRVVYTATNPCLCSYDELKPVVHKLEFDFSGSTPSAKLGKSESQKVIPATADEGTFQIRNKVFVNTQGCVLNTGITIAPRQKKKVALGRWNTLYFMELLLDSLDVEVQVVNFKFNKKAVLCKRCIKGQRCEHQKKNESESDSDSES